MTVDEIIADLRDIHAPPSSPQVSGIELAWSPFVVLMVGVILWLAFVWWQRIKQRLEYLERLHAANTEQDQLARWKRLISLAEEIRLRNRNLDRLPDCAHIPARRAEESQFAEINSYLREALQFKIRS